MTRTHAPSIALALAFAAAAVFTTRALANAPQRKDDKNAEAVRAVIEAQAAAWNRGDIEGYMDGYERSDEIVFVSGDDVTRGWQTVHDRYKRKYDTREKMGTLSFGDLSFKPLDSSHVLVVGRWRLTLVGGDTPNGRFTLVFRRTAKGWRIIHDHTSSASQ